MKDLPCATKATTAWRGARTGGLGRDSTGSAQLLTARDGENDAGFVGGGVGHEHWVCDARIARPGEGDKMYWGKGEKPTLRKDPAIQR